MSSIFDDNKFPRPDAKPVGPDMVHQAEPYYPPGSEPESPGRKKSGCGCLGCFAGCLAMVVIFAIVAGIATWYTVRQIPDLARQGIAKAVEESELNPDDKQMVMQQVDRLVDGYKEGRVTLQELGKFAEDFAQSPLMDLLIAFGARVQYIDESGLSDEEKVEAERTLHRVARGVIEEKISQEELDVALNHISNEMGNGGRQFKDQVSDLELRAFLSESKRLADEAEIPDDDVKVDVSAELKKLVDRALGEGDELNIEPGLPEMPSESASPPDPNVPTEAQPPSTPLTPEVSASATDEPPSPPTPLTPETPASATDDSPPPPTPEAPNR